MEGLLSEVERQGGGEDSQISQFGEPVVLLHCILHTSG